MIDRNEVLTLIDGCEEQALESADGSGGGRGGIESAFRKLREALAAKAEPQGGEAWDSLAAGLKTHVVPMVGYATEAWDALQDAIARLEDEGAHRRSHPAPKPTEGEAPEAVREMLAEGWTLNYSPDTGFIGFAHPKGGRQSLLEIVRGRRDQDIGEFIVQALAAAPKRGRE